jgi:hypothetical protein
VPVLDRAEPVAARPTVPRPAWDWIAANQKKKEALTQLASLSAAMDDIDARIVEPAERTRKLDFD